MNTYFVGNYLRGWYSFQAPDEESAWEMGKEIFAAHYPSAKGRQICLIGILRDGYTDPAMFNSPDVPKHSRSLL